MDNVDLMALEKLLSSSGCMLIFALIIWRLPDLLQKVLDFGRHVNDTFANVLLRALQRCEFHSVEEGESARPNNTTLGS